jgi:hypothetical protein
MQILFIILPHYTIKLKLLTHSSVSPIFGSVLLIHNGRTGQQINTKPVFSSSGAQESRKEETTEEADPEIWVTGSLSGSRTSAPLPLAARSMLLHLGHS